MEQDEADDIIAIEPDDGPVKKKSRTSGPDEPQPNGKAKSGGMGGSSSSYFGRKVSGSEKKPTLDAQGSKLTMIPSRATPIPRRPPSLTAPPAILESYRLPKIAPPLPSQSGSAFANYSLTVRYEPGSSQKVARPARTAAQEALHEKWQARVVGGLLPRRRSLALDEAAAAEARRLAAGGDAVGSGDGEEDGIVGDDMEEIGPGKGMEDEEAERAKAASGVGSKLAAKYAAKAADDPKAKVKGKGKKKEEVGPSGQTYTPLEKQFMVIKAENPDVLLMMEVGYKYK